MYPSIRTFDDVLKHADELIEVVESTYRDDYVYMISTENDYNKNQDWCIAGSKAVHEVGKFLGKDIVYDDVDIFFLNSPKQSRTKCDNVDIVHLETKTPEKLLMDFDLPCCRAAYNGSTFWVSVQCLYSILTGKYHQPKYLECIDTFKAVINKNRSSDLVETEEFYFQRLQERTAKYQQRGFTCIYRETTHILLWITKRFHYGQWNFDS